MLIRRVRVSFRASTPCLRKDTDYMKKITSVRKDGRFRIMLLRNCHCDIFREMNKSPNIIVGSRSTLLFYTTLDRLAIQSGKKNVASVPVRRDMYLIRVLSQDS